MITVAGGTACHRECDSDISYVADMTTRVRRRRGTPIQGSYFRLDPEVKAQIDEYSDRFGVPTWAIIEAAIRAANPETWDLPTTGDEPLFDLHDSEGAPVRRSA